MTDERRAIQFETEQLPAFLDHIARNEAEELARLRRKYETAARAVRTEARRRSRLYHRRISEETRARIEMESKRSLSRTRNQIRRRLWETLQALRDRAQVKIVKLLEEYWQHPDRQLAWCRYWLDHCEKFGDRGEIRIRLSDDVRESTIEAIRDKAAEDGHDARIKVDESLEKGILIQQGERSIDGLLQSQLEHVLKPVVRELSVWLHSEGGGEAEE